MKSAGKARSNGLYRHIRTSKEIIRNLLNDSANSKAFPPIKFGGNVTFNMIFLEKECNIQYYIRSIKPKFK